MKIDAVRFGLAAGILWGISLFVLTLISMGTGYASEFLKSISYIYPGYSISGLGSIMGAVDGFIDGFVGCWIFIKIYNALLRKGQR